MEFFKFLKNQIKKAKITEEVFSKRDFYNMLNNNRKNAHYGKTSNCIGTALYLVGEQERDECVWNKRRTFFEKLKLSEKPGLGYIITWGNETTKLAHAAVITGVNPMTVATRNGSCDPFEPKQKFEETNEFYSGKLGYTNILYFIPSRLQKILDEEGGKN